MDLLISIEEMTGEDLETVSAIEQASFKDPWSLHSFQAEIETNHHALYLVARLEGLVIGYLGAWIVFEQVHITTLAVKETYRRRGIAIRLVEELVKKVAARGGSCLTLEVRPSNRAARLFYKKLGFEITGRRKHYYAEEDALIMTKYDLKLPERIKKGGAR